MRVLSVVGWNEPDGTRHEAGEVAEIDPAKVPDLNDLSFGKTVHILPDEPERKPSEWEARKPFKPPMETKETKETKEQDNR